MDSMWRGCLRGLRGRSRNDEDEGQGKVCEAVIYGNIKCDEMMNIDMHIRLWAILPPERVLQQIDKQSCSDGRFCV